MKIITISGLDGSGKSTQIQMLKNYLESQGKRVFYFHAVNFSLANKLTKKDNNTSRSVTKAGWLSIWLRKIFLRIDLWRFENLFKKLEKSGFDYLLSDRYFYDSVINIEYLSGKKWLLTKIKQPDLAIYLKISPEIIMSRERVPDQGIAYLREKEAIYETKMSKWNMRVIDGNRDKNTVFDEIKRYLK